MFVTATRDKIKDLKEVASLERLRKFLNLIKVIRAITLQFKSHKDLTTALMMCLRCIYECK